MPTFLDTCFSIVFIYTFSKLDFHLIGHLKILMGYTPFTDVFGSFNGIIFTTSIEFTRNEKRYIWFYHYLIKLNSYKKLVKTNDFLKFCGKCFLKNTTDQN